jgi:F-type H+-transporting ATPase subunit delta
MKNRESDSQNKNTVLVKTAVLLAKQQKDEIAKILKSKLGIDYQVENLVDETLIAGIYLRIGDQVFDTSFRTHFEKIRERLNQ